MWGSVKENLLADFLIAQFYDECKNPPKAELQLRCPTLLSGGMRLQTQQVWRRTRSVSGNEHAGHLERFWNICLKWLFEPNRDRAQRATIPPKDEEHGCKE